MSDVWRDIKRAIRDAVDLTFAEYEATDSLVSAATMAFCASILTTVLIFAIVIAAVAGESFMSEEK